MAALGLVGVQWVLIGYALAFGESAIVIPEIAGTSAGGFIGYSPELVGLGSFCGDSGHNVV